MRCARCRHENPPQAKFCSECGASLAACCAACGAELAAGAKFCSQCGSPVQPEGAQRRFASPDAYTPKHLADRILTASIEGERKQVTVLFADLKSSMELLAERDPEEARKLLDPVLERMMEAVHHYEGTVNQVMGDGIMALFGAPLAHEDHAVRACFAALRMQEAIRRYGEEARRLHGVELRIRIGLNSGEVVVRSIGSDLRMDYTAVGQTTHLAARMEQLATPGTTRLTAAVLALAEGYVEVKPVGPVPVKGIAEPVEVFELLGASSVRSRLQAARARGLTRFVGRDSEMAQLRAAAEQARGGRGQVVAVVGEPGVGKSRLYYEFIHSSHTHAWLVVESSSVSYGKATAYLPLTDLLRAYLKIDPGDDPRAVRAKVTGNLLALDEALQDAVAPVLWLFNALPQDSPFLRIDPTERRHQTLAAVRRILLRESQVQPLVLVFEDLHWIDGETQAFLDSFVEGLPAARILLAVNYRPEYRHDWSGKSYYRQLRIDPLPPESAQDLLEGLLGADPSMTPLKALLAERAQGNPLFLEESVRTLVETGTLAGARGAYRLLGKPEAVRVPATVQAILAARIDRLDPADKRLLQAAAVVGTDVPYVLLRELAELGDTELRSGLDRLQAAEFVYESRLFPELEYAFRHALTHDVAYDGVLHERKRALHAAVVVAFERLHPERIADQVEFLAHHALRGGMGSKAVHYLHQAGVKAAAGSASRQAVEFLQHALSLLEALPQTMEHLARALDIRMVLGPPLVAIKGPASAEVEDCYRRALALVDRLQDEPRRFPALWGLWFGKYTRGEYPEAIRAGEQLLAVAREGAESGLVIEAHHAMWPTLAAMARHGAAVAHIESGLALYQRERHGGQAFLFGGHDAGTCAYYHLAGCRWIAGAADAAVSAIKNALKLSEELHHPLTRSITLWFTAWLHYERGELALAQHHLDELIEIVSPPWRAGTLVLREACTSGRHAPAALRALGRELDAGGASTAWRRALSRCILARMFGEAGEPKEGLAVLASISPSDREGIYAPEFSRAQGDLMLMLPSASQDAVERCYRSAIEVSRRREERSLELRAAMCLARLWATQDRARDAQRLVEEVLSGFSEGFDTADLRAAKALVNELG